MLSGNFAAVQGIYYLQGASFVFDPEDDGKPKGFDFLYIYEIDGATETLVRSWGGVNRLPLYKIQKTQLPRKFPTETKEITAEWLTRVLHDSDAIPKHVRVASVSCEAVKEFKGFVGTSAVLDLTFSEHFENVSCFFSCSWPSSD